MQSPELGTPWEHVRTGKRAWSIMRIGVWLEKVEQPGFSWNLLGENVVYFPIHSVVLKETTSKSTREH